MAKNIILQGFTVIILTLLTGSCISNLICIDGNGVKATDERSENNFTQVINTTDADIIFKSGEEYSITVEADENLINYYHTSVSGNALTIEIKDATCVRGIIAPVIRITAPGINGFTLSGSGNMIGDMLSGSSVKIINSGSGNIFIDYIMANSISSKVTGSGDITVYDSDSDEVSITISGAGDMTINGESEMGHFTSSGSGHNYSGGLILADCNAIISGSGDIYTSVNEELHATLSGSGNLYYSGSPQVYQSVTGSGRIIRIEK